MAEQEPETGDATLGGNLEALGGTIETERPLRTERPLLLSDFKVWLFTGSLPIPAPVADQEGVFRYSPRTQKPALTATIRERYRKQFGEPLYARQESWEQLTDWLEELGNKNPEGLTLAEVAELLRPAAPQTNALNPESPIPPTALETLLGPENLKILEIVRSSATADEKMRKIYDIDKRFLAWDSPMWQRLLGVTSSAIRNTSFWIETRSRHLGAD
jgi:hypothetical protein